MLVSMLTGCFSVDWPKGLACDQEVGCPEGQECLADGICHALGADLEVDLNEVLPGRGLTFHDAPVVLLHTNPLDRFDVNDDGFVSPSDALAVINRVNESGEAQLGELDPTPPYLDVDGDSWVREADAQAVLDYLETL